MRNFWKCLLYDINQGTRKQSRIYVIAVVMFFFLGMNVYSELKFLSPEISMADIAVKLFYGADIFREGDLFQIPYYYMIITAFVGMSIGNYVLTDYKEMGVVHIVKYQNKSVWWYGKCLWNIWHTILLFVSIFIGIMLFGCIIGILSWKVSPLIPESGGYFMVVKEDWKVFSYIFILGICTVIVLNQIQIVFQMMFDSITAYIVYLGNLVFSVLIYSKYLPGNNLMLCRTKIFQEEGIEFWHEIVYLFILWFISVLIGCYFVKKSDVL